MKSLSMLEGAIECGTPSPVPRITSSIPELPIEAIQKASSSKLIWYIVGAIILAIIIYIFYKKYTSANIATPAIIPFQKSPINSNSDTPHPTETEAENLETEP